MAMCEWPREPPAVAKKVARIGGQHIAHSQEFVENTGYRKADNLTWARILYICPSQVVSTLPGGTKRDQTITWQDCRSKNGADNVSAPLNGIHEL